PQKPVRSGCPSLALGVGFDAASRILAARSAPACCGLPARIAHSRTEANDTTKFAVMKRHFMRCPHSFGTAPILIVLLFLGYRIFRCTTSVCKSSGVQART